MTTRIIFTGRHALPDPQVLIIPPAVDRASTSKLGALAVDCVTSCETRLVVLDDLHFVDFKHRNGIEVSNHLKGLANEMAATFVYVGVQLAEKRFFDEGQLGEQAAYAQTSRRATRCPVVPFAVDTDPGLRSWITCSARWRGTSSWPTPTRGCSSSRRRCCTGAHRAG